MARTITVTKTINEEMGNELLSFFVDDCEIFEDDYDIRYTDLAFVSWLNW